MFTSCISRIKFPRADLPQTSYPASQVASLYGFPTLDTLASQPVAVISLGGGFSLSDVKLYADHYGFPVPPISVGSVNGAGNQYSGDAKGPDAENALDIQELLGATHGLVPIKVFFAPNSEQGFAAAIMRVAQENQCCVCSISWGTNEDNTSNFNAMDQALNACISNGIPVFAASGDDGSRDGGFGNNVDFPASSPYTIGVGGTTLLPDPTGAPGSITQRAWSYGGGGFSKRYQRPEWQVGGITYPIPSRGVPDVAGNSDPNSGYPVVVGGQWGNVGGTSAAAPLWAAAIALIVAKTGKRLYRVHEYLYAKDLLTDVLQGSNGAYKAGQGWDPCTGKGTPNAKFFRDIINAVSPPPVIPVPTPTTTPTPIPQPRPPTPGGSMSSELLAGIKLAINLLEIVAKRTANPYDDIAVGILKQVVAIWESGQQPSPQQMMQIRAILASSSVQAAAEAGFHSR